MTEYTLRAFGELAAHIFAPLPAAAPVVDILRLGRVEITLGGGSALVCQQVAALGHRTRLEAMVGDDVLGGWLLGELARQRIDCPDPIRSGTRSTRTLTLHAASGTHDITHEPSDGSPAEFVPAAARVSASDCQFAYSPGFPGFEPVLEALAATGVTTVVDLGYRPWLTNPDNYQREVLARARFATVCLLSGDGLDPSQRQRLMAEAAGQGSRVVVATTGPNGGYVLDEMGRIRHVPAVPCRPVNTLGAGDSFTAGLIVALAEGREPADAVAYACATAAAVISMFPVVPDRADVEAYRSAEQARIP